MKELLKNSKEIFTRWRTDRSLWFKVGLFFFIAYVSLLLSVLVILLVPPLVDVWNQKPVTMSLLELGVPYGLYIMYMELCADDRRLSWKNRILLNKKFVAFGHQATKRTRFFLVIELLYLTGHSLITILCYFYHSLATYKLTWMLIVNFICFTSNFLLHYSFSKFFDLSSQEHFDASVQDLAHRTENHIQTTSKVSRESGKLHQVHLGILYNKKFLAFGPNASYFVRIFLLTNVLFIVVHSIITIRFYLLDKIYVFDLFSMITINLFNMLFIILHHYSFSEYYNLTSRDELSDVIQMVDSDNRDWNKKSTADKSDDQSLIV